MGTIAGADWKPRESLFSHCLQYIPGSLRAPLSDGFANLCASSHDFRLCSLQRFQSLSSDVRSEIRAKETPSSHLRIPRFLNEFRGDRARAASLVAFGVLVAMPDGAGDVIQMWRSKHIVVMLWNCFVVVMCERPKACAGIGARCGKARTNLHSWHSCQGSPTLRLTMRDDFCLEKSPILQASSSKNESHNPRCQEGQSDRLLDKFKLCSSLTRDVLKALGLGEHHAPQNVVLLCAIAAS